MQPDYTFALDFSKPSLEDRAHDVQRRLVAALSADPSKPGCMLYRPRQAQRLLGFLDDLGTLVEASMNNFGRRQAAELTTSVLADVVASNLGFVSKLSAASKGPFRVCGETAELLQQLTKGAQTVNQGAGCCQSEGMQSAGR
jgi:hypothetical protein